MMQPGPGMAPPTMAQQPNQQYQQQQQQPYMMMPPQPQPPQMWAQSAQPPPQSVAPPQQVQPTSADEVRTLWIGDLQYWMDENYLYTCFAHTGEVASVKVIRNKQTSQSEGYGFIEFTTRAAAERILQTYNGTIMPNGGQNFRLNWATFSAGERRHDDSPDYTVFVGDLAADVTDYLLTETFRVRYSSVKGAKVVIDRTTGRTKGYGFVRFADESEQVRAMTEMQGVLCSTRPMRIGPASNKNPGIQPKASYQNPQGAQNENDPNNTTIFVGNLDPNVTDDHLRQVFGQYGELAHVKIPAGKRCGFVQFADRSCAEEALRVLNGTLLGGQNVRLSWGRSPSNKQVIVTDSDPNQWNGSGGGGYYGYAQGYENYGYAPTGQDPNMYGGYPGYANYQPPQQQQQMGYS
ncbi:polyadenylate-binding protein RBP45 isoform X2 [Gastrolobium bilobum]|uniref:polyadenylate-binding protein RBP45 isoform X2 n=1 Tax=Gastrolobium bilobum TaxID=150636 RepID=UPI002AB24C60|nr:polyadenylate-binding protein RBP45 isoform X2 [Gastrolobium bilobum]